MSSIIQKYENQRVEKTKEIFKLKEVNQDLANQLENIETVKQYEGHMNQSQKIKYVLRLKEEINDLKKELKHMRQEMQLKEEQQQHIQMLKDPKSLESKILKLKEEIEKKNEESKKTIKNTVKLCDYILTRAVYPDEFRDEVKD